MGLSGSAMAHLLGTQKVEWCLVSSVLVLGFFVFCFSLKVGPESDRPLKILAPAYLTEDRFPLVFILL